MSTTPDPAAYDWLRTEASWLGQGGCVTVAAPGHDREQVAALFGADLRAPLSRDQVAARTDLRRDGAAIDVYLAPVSFTTVDGLQVAVEQSGWNGTQHPVLQALSVGGSAACTFFQPGRIVRFAWAREGVVMYDEIVDIAHDPEQLDTFPAPVATLLRDAERFGSTPLREQDLWAVPAHAMALVEACTGVRVTREHLRAAHERAYIIRLM